MCALLLRGRLERLDLDALRIDHADGVPNRAALAGGVHPLQHDQDPRRGLLRDPAGRVQPLLQVTELGLQRRGGRRGIVLGAGESRRGRRVDVGQIHRPGRQSQELGQRLRHGGHRHLVLLRGLLLAAHGLIVPDLASGGAGSGYARMTRWS